MLDIPPLLAMGDSMLSPYVAKSGSSRIGLLKGKLKFGEDWWAKDKAADAEIQKSFAED